MTLSVYDKQVTGQNRAKARDILEKIPQIPEYPCERPVGRKVPFVGLDVNILIEDFLYNNPDYIRGNSDLQAYAQANRVMALVKNGRIKAFADYDWVENAKEVLGKRYGVRRGELREFANYINGCGVKFYTKRQPVLSKQVIDGISNHSVHKNDAKVIKRSLENHLDALITDDKRIVKNPTVLHYLPVLSSKEFLDSYVGKKRTRKEYERISYQNFMV